MPVSFKDNGDLPEELEIPFKRQYEYMIYKLMIEYGISREKAGNMYEYDFMCLIAYKNIEGERENYNIENAKGNN
jgi:hypothetical protein